MTPQQEKLLAAFQPIKGLQLHTKGPFTHPKVLTHANRYGTFADLADSPLTVKAVVVRSAPTGTVASTTEPPIDAVLFELVQDKTPKDFKTSLMTGQELMSFMYLKDGYLTSALAECARRITEEPQNTAPVAASVSQEGWGAWA